MFTVTGTYDGIDYTVTVDSTADDSIRGTARVLSLLNTINGSEVAATPTGPFLTLGLDDPKSVLAALTEYTEVTGITGNPPEIVPPTIKGAVY